MSLARISAVGLPTRFSFESLLTQHLLVVCFPLLLAHALPSGVLKVRHRAGDVCMMVLEAGMTPARSLVFKLVIDVVRPTVKKLRGISNVLRWVDRLLLVYFVLNVAEKTIEKAFLLCSTSRRIGSIKAATHNRKHG